MTNKAIGDLSGAPSQDIASGRVRAVSWDYLPEDSPMAELVADMDYSIQHSFGRGKTFPSVPHLAQHYHVDKHAVSARVSGHGLKQQRGGSKLAVQDMSYHPDGLTIAGKEEQDGQRTFRKGNKQEYAARNNPLAADAVKRRKPGNLGK
jgi:hypothetical protein